MTKEPIFFDAKHIQKREYYKQYMTPELREKTRQKKREYYWKNRDHILAMRKKWLEQHPNFSTESKLRTIHRNPERHRARTIKGRYVTLKSACEKCGTNQNLEGHHEDYSKLLEVTTLCKQCHEARHLELKEKGIELTMPTKEEMCNRHCNNCGKSYPACGRGHPSFKGRPCNLWIETNKEDKP